MVELMPEGTWFMDKRLTSIEENPAGGVTLTFDDGSMYDADAVVGADGIKSKTRQILLGPDNPDAKPKYSGEFGYRSLVPMEKAVEVLGEDFAKNGNVNIAKGALTTTYPVEKGTMLNIVAARDQQTWDDQSWVLPADKDTVEKEFEQTGPQMKKVVSLLDNPQKWSLW
jgi:salicylate hydroxylase